MAETLEARIANARHTEWSQLINSFQFWRAAQKGILDGGNPLPEEIVLDDLEEDFIVEERTNYLYAFPFESERSYRRRLRLSQDFGNTAKVQNSYTGHFIRSKPIKEIGFDKNALDKFTNNIDSVGSNEETFRKKTVMELFGMGRAWVFTDAPPLNEEGRPVGFPSSFVIPRRDMLDWDIGEDGLFDFVIFRRFEERSEPSKFSKERVEQRIAVNRERMLVLDLTRKGWKIVQQVPNAIGLVPMAVANMGIGKRPITEAVSKFDVNMLNMDSVINQILRLQGVAIPFGPSGLKKQLSKGLGVNSIVEVPRGDTLPGWAAFPANTLDGHFRYLQWMVDNVLRVSNTREISTPQSGISKQWDWLDTEAILITARDEIQALMGNVIKFWGMWLDITNLEFTYTISDKDFAITKLNERLQNIQLAIAIDLGATVNADLKKKAAQELQRQGLIGLTKELIEKAEQEIDEQESFGAEAQLVGTQ